jgi:hypothetical protein
MDGQYDTTTGTGGYMTGGGDRNLNLDPYDRPLSRKRAIICWSLLAAALLGIPATLFIIGLIQG